jgi:hypothetical protein
MPSIMQLTRLMCVVKALFVFTAYFMFHPKMSSGETHRIYIRKVNRIFFREGDIFLTTVFCCYDLQCCIKMHVIWPELCIL